MRELYERDYIAAWDGMLRDLELVPFTTVRQTADALGILSSAPSGAPDQHAVTTS